MANRVVQSFKKGGNPGDGYREAGDQALGRGWPVFAVFGCAHWVAWESV
jgi:hypothetical protein